MLVCSAMDSGYRLNILSEARGLYFHWYHGKATVFGNTKEFKNVWAFQVLLAGSVESLKPEVCEIVFS